MFREVEKKGRGQGGREEGKGRRRRRSALKRVVNKKGMEGGETICLIEAVEGGGEGGEGGRCALLREGSRLHALRILRMREGACHWAATLFLCIA